MTLPMLLSVPHAGVWVPDEARPYCRLTAEDLVADGDVGAAEIYALRESVAQWISTDVARAIVDLNRAPEDFRADGVIKTHTCWNVPVYSPLPPRKVVDDLLNRYYLPYHDRLVRAYGAVPLAIDCHTMAAMGPPIGPDQGGRRPAVCLGDGHGKTLPSGWMGGLVRCFATAFGGEIAVNRPFSGGYITRRHGEHMPWCQLEISRAPFMTDQQKRACVLRAITDFSRRFLST